MPEFKVDFNKLNEKFQQEQSSKSGGIIFDQKQIPDNGEIDFRLLPPTKNMNGIFYLKVTTVWINNIPYVSPRTLGKDCPMLDIRDQVMESKDEQLNAIIGNEKLFKVNEHYEAPMLLLKWDDINKTYSVIDNAPKVFRFTFQLYKGINAILSNRRYQSSALGIFDPIKGFNLIGSKEVKNKRVVYAVLASPEPMEVPESYLERIPDLYELITKRIYSYEYLTGVMENLLYGDKMPSEDLKFSGTVESTKEEPKRERITAPPVKTEEKEQVQEPPKRIIGDKKPDIKVETDGAPEPRKRPSILDRLNKE